MTIRIIRDKTYEKGYRPFFYLVYKVRGKQKNRVMSDFPVRGTPPASLSMFDKGDETYERSKAKAMARAKELGMEQKSKVGHEKLLADLIESKIGKAPKEVDIQLADLYSLWASRPREKDVVKGRKQAAKKAFTELAEYMKTKKFVVEVTKEDARAYYQWLKKTYAHGAVQGKIGIIRSCFKDALPAGIENPFEGIITRHFKVEDEEIHRKPLSMAECDKVLALAASDKNPMIHNIAVGCSETGMRVGDVCKLKWDDIDWKTRIIFCKTSKAKKNVAVPISDMLYERLQEARTIQDGEEPSPYVWPEAAKMYETNKSGIYKRGGLLFAKALFGDEIGEPEVTLLEDGEQPPVPPTILEAMDLVRESRFAEEKKDGMLKVLEAKMEGMTTTQIVRNLHFNKSRVCEYLREIFRFCNLDLRAQRTPLNVTKKLLDKIRVSRAVGQRAASIYGWHSFRGTFAIKAKDRWGVSIEDIMLIIGHAAKETTLASYLNPTKKIQLENIRFQMNADNRMNRKLLPPSIEIQPADTTTATDKPSLAEIIKGLSPEAKAKIPALPADAKTELKKTTSVEDAEILLSLY